MTHVTYWHKTDIGARADDVSSLGQSRHCGCERRDLILTREYLRSSPRVGGGQIAGTMRGADRWDWFTRKKFGINPKSPLMRVASLRLVSTLHFGSHLTRGLNVRSGHEPVTSGTLKSR